MTSRQKVLDIANRKNSGGFAFWTGHPHKDTVPLYTKAAGVSGVEGVYKALNDDCRWVMTNPAYKHPNGKPMFEIIPGEIRSETSEGGFFAGCEDIKDIERFPWPDTKYLDFGDVLKEVKGYADAGLAVFSGFWTSFFHDLCFFFGMETTLSRCTPIPKSSKP